MLIIAGGIVLGFLAISLLIIAAYHWKGLLIIVLAIAGWCYFMLGVGAPQPATDIQSPAAATAPARDDSPFRLPEVPTENVK
jgi:hypothetical protein